MLAVEEVREILFCCSPRRQFFGATKERMKESSPMQLSVRSMKGRAIAGANHAVHVSSSTKQPCSDDVARILRRDQVFSIHGLLNQPTMPSEIIRDWTVLSLFYHHNV